MAAGQTRILDLERPVLWSKVLSLARQRSRVRGHQVTGPVRARAAHGLRDPKNRR